jgi:hypothetical protein
MVRSRSRTGDTSPYMDAPTCPGFRALSGLQGEIAPVHSDFCCNLWVAVHDGFCWTVPHRGHALEVLRGGRVLPSTVQPVLPSLRDYLSNLGWDKTLHYDSGNCFGLRHAHCRNEGGIKIPSVRHQSPQHARIFVG